MALPSMRPQSPFEMYVATEAEVPGKDGASAALIARFDAMPRGCFVFVQEDGAVYAKPKAGFYTADGNRIVLISSGSSGTDGVDGIFSNSSGLVVVGNLVAKDINPNNVVLADASDGTLPAFGVVVDVIDDVTCVVREFGECTPTPVAAFTIGATVYLSELAGKATTTAPTTAGAVVQKIGIAKSTTEVILGITPAFGGGIYTKDGVVAQPAWSFASQPGTGVYLSSSTIGVGINGVNVATMATSGFTYTITSGTTDSALPVAYLVRTTTGTPAAGIGTALGFVAEAQVGANVVAGSIEAAFSDVTPGAELAYMTIGPSRAGDPGAGLRVAATMQSTKNGLEVRPVSNAAAAATGVSIAPYAGTGGATDITVSIAPVGAANILLNGGATGGVQIGVNAAAKVGFFTTAPVVQQVLATGTGATVDNVITFLQTIGLCKQA